MSLFFEPYEESARSLDICAKAYQEAVEANNQEVQADWLKRLRHVDKILAAQGEP